MSQRNRIVLAVAILTAALCGVAPAPSHAVGFRPWRVPVVDIWEQAWNRLAALLPQAASPKPPARPEKEGGAINPNGGTTSGLAPLPQGTATKPDGVQ